MKDARCHVLKAHLNTRLRANSVVEKLTARWLDDVLARSPELKRV